MKLYMTPRHFILQTLHLGKQAQLVMDRRTGRCFCTSGFSPLSNGTSEQELLYLEVFCIVGVLPIEGVLHLVAVTEADVVGVLSHSNIYSVKAVELLQFEENVVKGELIESNKRDLSKLLISGFYFSYHYDLCNSLQRAAGKTGNLHERADKQFYWNFRCYQDLVEQGVHSQ